MEFVSMYFLFPCQHVTKPHRLTSKASEHTFSIPRGTIREFEIPDYCHIIKKLFILNTPIEGNVEVFQYGATRYGGKINSNHKKNKQYKYSHQLPIAQDYRTEETNTSIAFSGITSISEDNWKELSPIIHLTSKGLKDVLKYKIWYILVPLFNI